MYGTTRGHPTETLVEQQDETSRRIQPPRALQAALLLPCQRLSSLYIGELVSFLLNFMWKGIKVIRSVAWFLLLSTPHPLIRSIQFLPKPDKEGEEEEEKCFEHLEKFDICLLKAGWPQRQKYSRDTNKSIVYNVTLTNKNIKKDRIIFLSDENKATVRRHLQSLSRN